jgi:hypothetical protein
MELTTTMSTWTRMMIATNTTEGELSNSEDLPGGPNHRPLVGGFAAVAYEAAKAHHYSMKQQDKDDAPKDRAPPPSI